MKQSSTMISQLRKSFTNENDYSPSKPAVFVPHKLSKGSPLDAGLEYSHDVRNDAQYISKIFETSSYDHNHESLVEFYSDICYIMDSKELTDQRNAGAVMGMAALGAFGLVTFSVSFAGGVAGVIFGGTLGRIIANKISDRRAKKSSKVTQEDLFKLKLQCMLQLAKTSKKSKNNLNGHRLQIEKIIEESALALEASLFKNPKAISDVLIQIRRMLLDVNVQKAMLLSYKLFKVYMKIKDLPENERLQNVAKKLNTIFIPYTKFIELDQKHQTSGDASLTTYYKIKVLLAKPEITEIIAQFPEYQLTPELLEKFQAFLAQEVDTVGPIKQAISKTSQPATMTEHNQLKGSKRKSVDPNKDMSPNLDNSSSSSLRDVKLEDIGEGGGICKTEIYNMELSKVKFQGGDSLSQNPIHNKIGAKAGDISLNEPSSMDDNWSRKEEKEGSIRKNHAGEEELERSNNEPEGRIFKRMGSKSRDYSQNYIDKDRSQLSQLAGLMKDERLDSPITPMTPVKDQPQSGNENILMKRASSKKDVKSQDKEKEEDINAKALAVNNNGVSQPSASNKAIFDKVLGIAYDEVTKWEKVINTPTIRIEKVRPEGSPVVLIRAWAVIEGYSPKEVFDQIYDAENRSKWDTVTVNLSVVEQIDPNTAVIHFIIKAPYPVSDRDFVQKRNFQLDYPEKGTITMSFQSFAHPKMPPVKNRIRGETHIAGYVLKASTKFPNSTDLCILTQVDIKGSIPKMIVNMVAGKAPAEWVSKLTKACERARQEKNKRGGK